MHTNPQERIEIARTVADTAAQLARRGIRVPAKGGTPDAVYTIERLKLSRRWATRCGTTHLTTTIDAEGAAHAVLLDALDTTTYGRAAAKRWASVLAEELRGVDVWRRTRREVRAWVEGR